MEYIGNRRKEAKKLRKEIEAKFGPSMECQTEHGSGEIIAMAKVDQINQVMVSIAATRSFWIDLDKIKLPEKKLSKALIFMHENADGLFEYVGPDIVLEYVGPDIEEQVDHYGASLHDLDLDGAPDGFSVWRAFIQSAMKRQMALFGH